MPRITTVLVCFLCVASIGVAQTSPTITARKPAATRTVWPDEGPRTWAPRPTSPAITANDLRTRLYQIADDSMMGRRIGELGNYKATEYVAGEFRRVLFRSAGFLAVVVGLV